MVSFRPCKELGKTIPEEGPSWCKGVMEGVDLYSRFRRNAGVEAGSRGCRRG